MTVITKVKGFVKDRLKEESCYLCTMDANQLVSSQWQKQPEPCKYYFTYRLVMAIFHTGWLLFMVIHSFNEIEYFFIYLTHWSYVILTLTNILMFTNVLRAMLAFKHNGKLHKSLDFTTKLQWALQNLTYTSAILVTLIYWGVVYKPGMQLTPGNIQKHLFNSITAMLDLAITRTRIRLLHMYIPVMYISAYTAFSLIYYNSGGLTEKGSAYIYTVMDWDNMGVTGPFLPTGIAIVVILQAVVWLLCLTRVGLHSALCEDGCSKNPTCEQAEEMI